MRGRRRHSPDQSVSQDQTRMALRKQVLKDGSDVPSGSHQIDDDTDEDEALEDDNDEFSSSLLHPSSSRGKRRRERDNKSKPKEMTEEEMMDLALRLSEQEASITALRLQKEEEAMMKAIHESMTQPCPSSQSQSLLSDPEASLRIGSRRKLLYSNGQPASEDGCTAETDLNRGAKRGGDGGGYWNKKRKRKEGSPLLEMPDLSQTQKINSQASTCISDVLELHLDSQQSTDSTQIDDCQLHKSPVFPSTGCRAEVHVPRLTQDLLQSCRTSGFVLCSLDSSTSPPKSPPAQPKSPTFPKSPERSDNLMTVPKSPVFSETDQDDGAETQPSPEYFKSPVFGRNSQHKKSSSASKPEVCNSGFMFSSQESLTSSVRSTSCQPKSPVFPSSPNVPPEGPAASRSPVFSETEGGQAEQSHRSSPVLGRCGIRQKIHSDEQKHSANPSAAELRGSICGGSPAATKSLRQDRETDRSQPVGLNESCKSDEVKVLKEISKDRESAEMELTSDMTLLLSDEDEDDVTPVGSPSPVFPEERPVHHVTAESPGTSGSTCRPSTSTARPQRSPTEREQRPISSQGAVGGVSAPPGQPAGGSTVHYYWGVPFCPRGLDPDSYTKVIVAQMEVYEKSLKEAQRCLLRKAEWGEAVLPQPEKSPSPEPRAESPQEMFPRRRGFRLRSKRLCDAAETPPAEAEEATEEEEDNKVDKEKEETENKEEETKNKGEGGQVDSDDCEVCPETQLSDHDDDRTQDLMIDADAGTDRRQKSPEPPEVQMILQDDSPAVQELQDEEMEVEVELDAPVDRKMNANIPVRSRDVGGNVGKEELEEDGGDPDVEEIKDRVLQRSSSPELEPAVVPRSPKTSVDCPICQGSFPVKEIEMHAAYCDGEVEERRLEADCFQVTSKLRRKRTRRADLTAEETNDPPNTVKNPEKCFICQRAVPLRDYSRHTELCIQRQTSKASAKGNLLSALEKTDSRDSEAGPSGSKPQPSDVIDLRDDDDDEEEEEEEGEGGGVSAFRVSNSPIRSFTPISEAAGCLIDFKKQHRTKKLSQRRR